MKWIERDLGSDLEQATIVTFGDLHIGDPRFDIGKFTTYRDWVLRDPTVFVAVNGDIGNFAIEGSKSDRADQVLNVNEQIKRAKELFAPLFEAKRILLWNDGNHEDRIYRADDGLQVGDVICDKFGQSELYTGDGALLHTTLGRQTGKTGNGKHVVYDGYFTHGFGGGKKPGAKANNVESLTSIVMADYYVMNHVHESMVFPRGCHVPDPMNHCARPIKRMFVLAGSFLGWGGYTERKGFGPSWTGTPRLYLNGKRKDIHGSV